MGCGKGSFLRALGTKAFGAFRAVLTAFTSSNKPAASPVVPSATSHSGWEPSSAEVHLKRSFSASEITSSKPAASIQAALTPAETAPRSDASFWDGFLSPQTAHTAKIIASMAHTRAASYILPMEHLCHNNLPQNTSAHTSGRLQACSR